MQIETPAPSTTNGPSESAGFPGELNDQRGAAVVTEYEISSLLLRSAWNAYRDLSEGDLERARSQSVATFTTEHENRLRRQDRLNTYIKEITRAHIISEEIAALSLGTWEKLSRETDNTVDVPDAGPGPDGDLLFVWRHGDRHFEIEFSPGSDPTAFYLDRTAGVPWESPVPIEQPVSAEILSRLKFFVSVER